MEYDSKPLPAIGHHMLGMYFAGAGILLEGSKNMPTEQIDYFQVRTMVENYRLVLDMFRGLIGKDETNTHEEAIGKLERFFEIKRGH